ncbi:Fe-S cluster assembly protein SufD [uncultured Bacteroides sp.]|uniref:Fe-S cluster assembly protein SufD n=1 Tax=uncultured Bacteroides sp. TaxID=162156 RepID=UPI0015AE8A08|nr:Fe-S cluster assembly protein SufD [uncultured Bacteroides sp.]
MKAEQQYIDLFTQCEAMICRHSAEALNVPRAKAFADFEQLGFPTRKQEKYKYTEVGKYFAPNYGLNLNRLEIPVNPYEVFKCDVPNMSTSLYFVVNDAFDKHVHPSAQLPEGVYFGSLKDMAEQRPELVKKYYGKLADTSKDALAAFNTMFAQDGVCMYVPKNVVMERPIQLVNILRADVDFMVNRRVLIILEEGAQAKLLVCDHAMDNVNFLSTQVVEVFAGENSVFDLYELEETHNSTVRFSNLYVHQEAGSNVLLNGMTLHNGTTRNTTEVTLAGKGAEINLCGMAIADANEQVDNNTFIDHKVSDCTSNELFKYVLDDQAVGAFAGKVLVREGAQHTSSQQTNRNLCATREARMYTQPQLEIYADDVKCSHGATVGQLDENALFYMQQRGISLKEARLLLMFAFVNEVIDHIRMDALKDRLHLLVEKRFRGELNKCQGCAICK